MSAEQGGTLISLHALHRTLAPHRMHCTALHTCIVWFTLFALFIYMHRTARTYRSILTACIIIRTRRVVCIVCLVCINCVVHCSCQSHCLQWLHCSRYLHLCMHARFTMYVCFVLYSFVYIVCMVLYGFVP